MMKQPRNGGRTRARTVDPLIKSQMKSVIFQWVFRFILALFTDGYPLLTAVCRNAKPQRCFPNRYQNILAIVGNEAESLERDPQMDSVLEGRKTQLGIAFESGRSLGAELAFNHGIDLGRGRGLGVVNADAQLV